jgi:lactate dehydrogenase-like 2-hydroxyacid dehydrogenase
MPDHVTPAPAPAVLATRRFAPEVVARLRDRFTLTLHDDERVMDRPELLAAVPGMRGVMLTPADRVDIEFLDAAGPNLEVIATLSVGLDHIDRDAVSTRGVKLAYTPEVLTRATAELAIAMMLSLLRRVTEGDRLIRAQTSWALSPGFMLGRSPAGLRFGCLGYGRIGREACRLASLLGMEVVHSGRVARGEPGEVCFDELIERSDVLSIHCPLTPETRHRIDAGVLARMKRDAVVINTSRGPVIDERALADALHNGEIGGAALDVFEHEPVVDPGLLTCEQVVLVPHLGSATHQARTAMGMLCADALEAVLLGLGTATNFWPGPSGASGPGVR